MVVEPFGFAKDSFLDESKAFGDGTAFQVADGAVQHYSIAALFAKCVIGESSRGASDNAAALVCCIDPIADFSAAIQRVDIVLADDTSEFSVAHDSESKAILIFKLFRSTTDEPGRVGDAVAVVEPRKPCPKVRSVAIDEEAEFFGVAL